MKNINSYINFRLVYLFLTILGCFFGFSTAHQKQYLQEIHFDKEYWLTQTQLDWLKEHPVIRYSTTPDYQPIEFLDENGQHTGLTAEYTRYIAKILGVEFQHISTETWDQTLELARQKKIDFITMAASSAERREYLKFTRKYINLPKVIFTNKTNKESQGLTLSTLKHKTVAIPSGYQMNQFIKENYPKVRIANYPTIRECIIATSLGEVDAYIGETLSTYQLIAQEGISNVVYNGPTGSNEDQGFAVRNDWSELVQILDAALDQVSNSQRQEFFKKWYKLPKESVKFQLMRGTLIMILLSCIALTAFFIYIGYKSKQEKKREFQISQSKNELFQSISEEVRAPLGQMINMLKCSIEEEDEAEQRHQIETALKNSHYLLTMVNEILDFSKMKSGKVSITPSAHRLEQIIRSIEPMFANVLDNDATVQVSVSDDKNPLPYRVMIDELRVQQVLVTLIRQFIKAQAKGTVKMTASWTPEAKRADLSSLFDLTKVSQKDGYLKLKIAGECLYLSDQKNQEVSPSAIQKDKSSYSDTQLSLGICHNLCSLMGGLLSIQSEGGQTCFNVILPLELVQAEKYKIEAEHASDLSAQDTPHKIRHVLVVDDSTIYQRLTMMVLSQGPYKPYPVSNGEDALTSMLENVFDYVLMDIEMPGMGGVETVKTRRAQESRSNLPYQIIFALTGHRGRDKEFLEAGFSGIITKPMNLESFDYSITTYTESRLC